jgi:hypothetical protein
MFCQRLALALALLTIAGPSAAAAPPPHGAPKILAVYISALDEKTGTLDVKAGQTVTSRVVTSPNVGYVEARVETHNQAMHRDGLGKFSLSYTIPWWLPFWLRHGWTLQVIARSIDGVEVKRYYPLTLH